MKDYYKILELEKTASPEEIKKSFKRLSKLHHPDKGGETEKFQEINEAYQTLSDKAKKYAYDNGTKYINISPPVIQDLHVQIVWTLNDVKNGKLVSFNLNKVTVCKTCNGIGSKNPSAVTTCEHCHGSGRIAQQIQTNFGTMFTETTCHYCGGKGDNNTDPCPTCHGNKMIDETIKESTLIPKGTIDHYIKIGAGHKTIHGDSNLIIHLIFQNYEGITFIGTGLHKRIQVDFFEALLGVQQIVTIGDVKLKVSINKETKSNQSFNLTNAYYGINVIIVTDIKYPTIEETKKYVLDIFKEDTELLHSIEETLNKKFK